MEHEESNISTHIELIRDYILKKYLQGGSEALCNDNHFQSLKATISTLGSQLTCPPLEQRNIAICNGHTDSITIPFTKMHGLGNDFAVINMTYYDYSAALSPENIRVMSNRHTGIGFDQLLLVERPNDPEQAAFKYRIFNSDGTEVEHCGNGARCFLKYVRAKKLTDKCEIPVETYRGIITLKAVDTDFVEVNMGPPQFGPTAVDFCCQGLEANNFFTYSLDFSQFQVSCSLVSMGNPHAVIVLDEECFSSSSVSRFGPIIESHPRFLKKTNVGFMEVVNRKEIKLRVYERGAGETLSCGTGACAAVCCGISKQLLDNKVTVHTRGGTMDISWNGDATSPVLLFGPATFVYEGNIALKLN